MASTIDKVKPGDLIRSDLLNQIIDRLADHEQRLVDLAGETPTSDALAVTAFFPRPSVRIGEELVVIGRGFTPLSNTTVTIDGVAPEALSSDSGDNQLIFEVPDVPNVPEIGRTVTVRVSGDHGTRTRGLLLLPRPAPPSGALTFEVTWPPVAKLDAGGSYDLLLTVTADTTADETYVVATSITPSTAGWQARLVHGNGAAIVPAEVFIPAGDARDLLVRVSIPGGVATGTAATLGVTLTSKRNPSFVQTTGDHVFKVGEAPPAKQTIPISLPQVTPETARVGDTIKLGANAVARLSFQAEISDPDDYLVHVEIPGEPTSWRYLLDLGNDAVTSPHDASTTVTSVGPKTIPVSLKATTSQAAAAKLILSVKHKTEQEKTFGTFDLKIVGL